MGIKGTIKRLAENLTGTYILKSLPRGVSLFNDIAVALPGYRIETVFDVGANIGQSAVEYARALPLSRIYSFEPIGESFKQLRKNTAGFASVQCIQLALAANPGKGMMLANETSTMNHLISNLGSGDNIDLPIEQVNIDTLEHFCEQSGIDRISYLKIDTEGTDMEVLKGAQHMLAQQRIDLVELEAGMNPRNTYHVPFTVLKEYLERHNYFLFGFYEQFHEWPTQEPHLRRTNPVFISSRMIEKHRRQNTPALMA